MTLKRSLTVTVLFTFLLVSYQACLALHPEQEHPESAAGCFCKGQTIFNNATTWNDEDFRQVIASVRECKKRYNKCLKKFTKVSDKGYTVLCGNDK